MKTKNCLTELKFKKTMTNNPIILETVGSSNRSDDSETKSN